jgi:hypothetical protein
MDGPVAVVGSANSGNILPIVPKIADKNNTRPARKAGDPTFCGEEF